MSWGGGWPEGQETLIFRVNRSRGHGSYRKVVRFSDQP